jgi:hypothetical protein
MSISTIGFQLSGSWLMMSRTLRSRRMSAALRRSAIREEQQPPRILNGFVSQQTQGP